MTVKRIAIISDLHVGENSNSSEFCTVNPEQSVITDFMEIFGNSFSNSDHKCDVLLVAGDITNRAKKDEFELASRRIKEIASILAVTEDNIYFTPGNHDSNWELGKTHKDQGETEEEKLRKIRYSFFSEDKFFSERVDKAKTGSFIDKPYSVLWENDDIVVLSVNSSPYDSAEKEIHHGEVDSKSLDSIRALLNKEKVSGKNKIKVLLVHHHPINYENRSYYDADFSIMKNGDSLINLAAEYCFDFIVHGHKHVPQYRHIINDYKYPVNVICSGSFTARMNDTHFSGVGNSIHFIEIDGFCDENFFPQGRLKSWSYFAKNGWIKNNSDRDSITHEERFGSSLTRHALKKILEEGVTESFLKKDFVKWSELAESFPSLKYCSTNIITVVLRELSDELSFDIMPGEELVLLKKVD